jgi:hypothetical protein
MMGPFAESFDTGALDRRVGASVAHVTPGPEFGPAMIIK